MTFGAKLTATFAALTAAVLVLSGIVLWSSSDADTGMRLTTYLVCGLALVTSAGGLVLIRSTTASIGRVVATVREGADQVSTAARQVAAASQSLAQGANEQSASLEQTSSSAVEITSMTKKNAENTESVAGLMQRAEGIVGNVHQKLDEMVRSMAEINASSDKISKIIKVIDEIAFQTNILALNAAVEAARAGEAGMGFAVVADEVRSLSQRCAQAARDTSGLIEESITKVADGARRLDDVNNAMRDNVEISANVKTLVDEVNLGSQEQARGMESIARAVGEMEAVTQRNAASAEQSASASQELTQLAQKMQAAIGQLDLGMAADVAEGSRGKDPDDGWKMAPSPRTALARPKAMGMPGPVGNRRPVSRPPTMIRREEIPMEGSLTDFQDFS
jgi:methyl-accepting chemotaxis protein/methyl-accepting chemotaxis protein-1 (serine sensor receptor)